MAEIPQYTINKVMDQACEGCAFLLQRGIRDIPLIFAGGLSNMFATLHSFGHDDTTIKELREALAKYAQCMAKGKAN